MEPQANIMEEGWEIGWHVVRAKAYRESLAAASLLALEVPVFLPRIRQEQPVAGVWRMIAKPLFPGYFFARFSPLVSLCAIRGAQGVLDVLGQGRRLVPVAEEVICELQRRVEADGYIRVQPKTFAPGDRVSIDRGLFEGWIGRVEREFDDGRRVAIFLEALQSRVLLEKRAVGLLVSQA